MRVVAGRVKGHNLVAPRGLETRPTSDKVRGAIFDILAGEFIDRPVLDLFAGTGALGIEALSRGATNGVFVERREAALRSIRANLRHTRLEDVSSILGMSCERAIPQFDHDFGLVLLDPPYAYPDLHAIMALIGGARAIGDETLVVFEHSPRFAVQERYARLALYRQKVYGDTAVSFFVAQEGSNA